MALLLGLGVYTVNAKMKALEAEKVQTDQEWTLTGTDRTDPESYTLAPGSTSDCVDVDETVCAIEAPADPNDSSIPQLSESLLEALEGDLDHDAIFKGPYNP